VCVVCGRWRAAMRAGACGVWCVSAVVCAVVCRDYLTGCPVLFIAFIIEPFNHIYFAFN
jgi:hypothetical protein